MDKLFVACKKTNKNAIKNILQDKTLDINKIFLPQNKTVLYHFCNSNDSPQCLNLLLKYPGIDINLKCLNGYSAPLIAAANEHVNCLNIFIQHPEIKINQTDDLGNTILSFICHFGLYESLKMILKNPELDLNIKGEYGYTALHECVVTKHLNCAELLLEMKNIDLSITDDNKQTALHLIRESFYNEYSLNVSSKTTNDNSDINNLMEKIFSKTDPINTALSESNHLPSLSKKSLLQILQELEDDSDAGSYTIDSPDLKWLKKFTTKK